MSLILEALRKSEAERRRGSTPDVAMELPPPARPRTQASPAWLLPFVLLAGLALLAAWWWSQRTTRTPDVGDTMATVGSPAPPIAPPAPPVVVARPPVAQVATPAPAAPAPVSAAPAPMADIPQPAPVRPLPPPPAPAAAAPPAIEATSMPPVKLSMHMWDAAPGKRFVILDGQRMGEGDRNGELTVVAIEPDGVVVERDGQRARVPLP